MEYNKFGVIINKKGLIGKVLGMKNVIVSKD